MTVSGCDSAVPAPAAQYAGKLFAGFYCGGDTPHIWERSEVAALGRLGVRGVLPIVVPPQSWPWPSEVQPPGISEVLGDLVAQAHRWGVPIGSPLALDIEPGQGDLMSAPQPGAPNGYLPQVRTAWRMWCQGRFVPWIYAVRRHHATVPTYTAWLAEWDNVAKIPQGFAAKQYFGGVGQPVDLDIALNGLTWMAADLDGLVTLSGDTAAPIEEPDMILALDPTTQDQWLVGAGPPVHVSPEDSQTLQHQGVPLLTGLSVPLLRELGIPNPTVTATPSTEVAAAPLVGGES